MSTFDSVKARRFTNKQIAEASSTLGEYLNGAPMKIIASAGAVILRAQQLREENAELLAALTALLADVEFVGDPRMETGDGIFAAREAIAKATGETI